ncbi:hypothetical protein EDM57_05295 [Brevibacillus gelatini]|uniref:Uncharacterized protein n=1 Tax=Brevibacillus gelatini TaxID=1655277 RepID=A0A3M8B6T4_9BACL|nr:hypothetical protein EDM57_05295 [Brevibacillus gelatini]
MLGRMADKKLEKYEIGVLVETAGTIFLNLAGLSASVILCKQIALFFSVQHSETSGEAVTKPCVIWLERLR